MEILADTTSLAFINVLWQAMTNAWDTILTVIFLGMIIGFAIMLRAIRDCHFIGKAA